ncbi:MAG: RNA polymerase sigma-70 factor (family 1) [Polaribacter sp.]|jgi:RNA polymerase sigma-70 factor (family 1)|uniref:RNA polymerase sigma factor n=1 Tax=Candidatus Marifrigoribacter sp. Uisw_064 TaxID=3230970 RepID=UPI003AEC6E65
MPEDRTQICKPEVFEKIFSTYAKDLKRYIFFKTQDMDLAEDILQETFIKLWDNCNAVTFSKVKSYLYTVATNIFLNHIKHHKVKMVYKKNYVKTSTNESPEFIMIEKEFLEKIENTIRSLPPLQREVFLLNRIEKKKYKEIAVMLDISVKAVEKRMHLALIVIRQEIGNV